MQLVSYRENSLPIDRQQQQPRLDDSTCRWCRSRRITALSGCRLCGNACEIRRQRLRPTRACRTCGRTRSCATTAAGGLAGAAT